MFKRNTDSTCSRTTWTWTTSYFAKNMASLPISERLAKSLLQVFLRRRQKWVNIFKNSPIPPFNILVTINTWKFSALDVSLWIFLFLFSEHPPLQSSSWNRLKKYVFHTNSRYVSLCYQLPVKTKRKCSYR